jgi:hypothetical protein
MFAAANRDAGINLTFPSRIYKGVNIFPCYF